MAISPGDRERLSELMEDRRLDLGLTLRQVAQNAGVSYESLRAMRSSTYGDPRPLTMRGLDRALHWKGGSVKRVLYDGGEPDALPLPLAPPPDPGWPQLIRDNWDDQAVRQIWGLETMPSPTRLGMITVYLDRRDR